MEYHPFCIELLSVQCLVHSYHSGSHSKLTLLEIDGKTSYPVVLQSVGKPRVQYVGQNCAS